MFLTNVHTLVCVIVKYSKFCCATANMYFLWAYYFVRLKTSNNSQKTISTRTICLEFTVTNSSLRQRFIPIKEFSQRRVDCVLLTKPYEVLCLIIYFWHCKLGSLSPTCQSFCFTKLVSTQNMSRLLFLCTTSTFSSLESCFMVFRAYQFFKQGMNNYNKCANIQLFEN